MFSKVKNRYIYKRLKHIIQMKSIVKILILTVIMFASTKLLQAQPHPNNGNAPSGSNTPVGAGAPLADGQFLLLAMGMAYAGRKIYLIPPGPKKA
jgi:hypothetical protein